ncbi:MAG TPA: DUF2071 domain-containing protein [Candidatus Angelobacter sp.]
MLPVVKGLIARRALLNFRADPDIVQKLLPKPFTVDTHQGFAIVGICLIRLEELRPKGLPAQFGIASENMAHRVAVRYPVNGEVRPGVFIWRRETDQKLVQKFGGRLFPGVHHAAQFSVRDSGDEIEMEVKSCDGNTDVCFAASSLAKWQNTSVFHTFEDVSEFFRQGDCGFSSALNGDSIEGMQLKTLQWSLTPLAVQLKTSSFYFDPSRFPAASIEFDCGLIMRRVSHEWHEIKETPEMQAASILV